MDEDKFNNDIRKFLKQVGVTSQQEIEKAVKKALEAGELAEGGQLSARVTLHVDGPDSHRLVEQSVEGAIRLS